MNESKQLKVTDLRIGDKVREKNTGYEYMVTGIRWGRGEALTNAVLCLDFGESPIWECKLDEVELIERGGEE